MQHNQIQNMFLYASAGSGKTFALCVRYIALLLQDVNANEILTLTFTKKAANEMKDRITHNLYALYTMRHVHTRDDLSQPHNAKLDVKLYQTKLDILQALQVYGITQENVSKKIAMIYFNFLQADKKITTIDSFYATILRKFAFFAGITQNFNIQEKNSHDEYFTAFLYNVYQDSVLRDTLRYLRQDLNIPTMDEYNSKLTLKSLLNILNDKSIEFKDAKDFHYKMNKDFTLQHARLLAQDYKIQLDINQIQAKIFEYASLLATYIRDITPEGKEDKKNLVRINQKLTSSNLKDIIEHTLIQNKTHGDITKSIKPNPLQQQEIERFCEDIGNLIRLYYEYIEGDKLHNLYLLIEKYKYNAAMFENKNNTLSFDSIRHKVFAIATNLLQNNQGFNSEYFYFRLDSTISHILFDEYQDTSIVQYRIFAPLFQEILSGKGTKEFKSLFFVGDSKQSLYRFRGANLAVFEESKKGLVTQSLLYNYRSRKNIIDFVNEKFAPIFSDYIPQLYPEFKEDSKRGDSKDEYCNKKQESHDGIVRIFTFMRENYEGNKQQQQDKLLAEDLYTNVCSNIQTLLSSGVKKKDIAILAREHKILQNFVQFAKTQNTTLEFNSSKNAKLIFQPTIQIIHCAFKIHEYKQQIQALQEHLESHIQDNADSIDSDLLESSILTDNEVTQDIAKKEENESLKSKTKELFSYLKFTQKKLNKLLGKSYFDTQSITIPQRETLAKEIKFVIEYFKLFNQDCMDLLEKSSLNPHIRNIDELFETFADIESKYMQEEAIHTLTIHSSKGLGFEHVFYIDTDEYKVKKNNILYDYSGILLTRMRLNDMKNFKPQGVEELEIKDNEESLMQEQNALYVACTRAKQGLYIFAHSQSLSAISLGLQQGDSKGNYEEFLQTLQDSPKDSLQKPIVVSYLKGTQALQKEYLHEDNKEELFYIDTIALKKKQVIGVCLHFLLELMLGYRIKETLSVVKTNFGFYLDTDELQNIVKKAENFVNMDLKQLNLNNNMIKCEVSFLQEKNIKRLDAIIRNNNEFVIFEFKSTQQINEQLLQSHKEQLQTYIHSISDIFQASLPIKGYLVYLQNKVMIKEVAL